MLSKGTENMNQQIHQEYILALLLVNPFEYSKNCKLTSSFQSFIEPFLMKAFHMVFPKRLWTSWRFLVVWEGWINEITWGEIWAVFSTFHSGYITNNLCKSAPTLHLSSLSKHSFDFVIENAQNRSQCSSRHWAVGLNNSFPCSEAGNLFLHSVLSYFITKCCNATFMRVQLRVRTSSTQLLPAKVNAKAHYSSLTHFFKAFICRVPKEVLLAVFYNPWMTTVHQETSIRSFFYMKYTNSIFPFFPPNSNYRKIITKKIFCCCS